MDHKKSSFRILAECDHGYIGICDCCREFNFAYKNILLTFQEEEICRFFDWIISKRNCPKHMMPLHNGRDRVFSSLNSNLFLAFHDSELEDIIQLYQQTRIMLEAERMLLANRMN
jgi:hypothetical protein